MHMHLAIYSARKATGQLLMGLGVRQLLLATLPAPRSVLGDLALNSIKFKNSRFGMSQTRLGQDSGLSAHLQLLSAGIKAARLEQKDLSFTMRTEVLGFMFQKTSR